MDYVYAKTSVCLCYLGTKTNPSVYSWLRCSFAKNTRGGWECLFWTYNQSIYLGKSRPRNRSLVKVLWNFFNCWS